jgi:pimeloyl-ACP methyl ester carboxylesterase
MTTTETVVLIHGLGGTRLDMWPIARRLRHAGFRTEYFTYSSLGRTIDTLAKALCRKLQAIEADLGNEQFHLVTFSMGGIIARQTLVDKRFESLGRVVMLAPPHRGSHAARRLAPFLGWLAPSLPQLSDRRDSFVNQLPNSLKQNGIEFGLVHASKDRVIAPQNILLSGFRDLAIVTGHHGVLPWYSRTSELTTTFLKHGSFALADESSHPAWNTTVDAL